METNLWDLFMESPSASVTWRGGEIYRYVELPGAPTRIVVEFVSSSLAPTQGLHLKSRNATFNVSGVVSPDMILWRDTAPDRVEVLVNPGRKGEPPSVKMWNVWRGRNGVIHAWIGNAAMRLEGSMDHGEFLLACSDGEGDPSFDDLRVRVTWSESPADVLDR